MQCYGKLGKTLHALEDRLFEKIPCLCPPEPNQFRQAEKLPDLLFPSGINWPVNHGHQILKLRVEEIRLKQHSKIRPERGKEVGNKVVVLEEVADVNAMAAEKLLTEQRQVPPHGINVFPEGEERRIPRRECRLDAPQIRQIHIVIQPQRFQDLVR